MAIRLTHKANTIVDPRFKTAPIYIGDVGNRAQETVYTHGQSRYLSAQGKNIGDPGYGDPGIPYKQFDLVETTEVLMSMNKGDIAGFVNQGLITAAVV